MLYGKVLPVTFRGLKSKQIFRNSSLSLLCCLFSSSLFVPPDFWALKVEHKGAEKGCTLHPFPQKCPFPPFQICVLDQFNATNSIPLDLHKHSSYSQLLNIRHIFEQTKQKKNLHPETHFIQSWIYKMLGRFLVRVVLKTLAPVLHMPSSARNSSRMRQLLDRKRVITVFGCKCPGIPI